MPVLQTMAYYNTVQNYEAAGFRRPASRCGFSAQSSTGATRRFVGMYLTKPVGFKTYHR